MTMSGLVYLMIAFSSDVLSLMLLQFTVRIRRFLLGGRVGIDVDSLLDCLCC
jgi:hypothetical protein